MFARIGILSTADYVDFLEYVKKDAEKKATRALVGMPPAEKEMTTSQLKNDIRTFDILIYCFFYLF